MEQHDMPDMIGKGLDYLLSKTHDRHALLTCSPATGLTFRDLRSPDQPREVSASTPPISASSFTPILNTQAGSVISNIEDLFLQMVDCIFGEGKELELQLKPRSKCRVQGFEADYAASTNHVKAEARVIRFPGRSAQEAWKFNGLFRSQIFIRDIYYKDPKLFIKQTFVDRYVDDIAFSLGVRRESLNIVAAAKGLIAGYLTIIKVNKDVLDCLVNFEGVLVPSMKEIERVHMREARWVLVVEKEATFHSLAVSRFWETSRAGKGILVTGKGYPDIRTRALVQVLSARDRFTGQGIHCSRLKVFVLVDYDPDGLAIISTYKYGSISLAHENNTLVAPGIEWLGITSSVIKDAHQDTSQGWLRLTSRDRTKVVKMLEKPVLQWHIEPIWRRELQVMLMLNIKAEIQILGEYSYLEGYLSSEIQSRMSI